MLRPLLIAGSFAMLAACGMEAEEPPPRGPLTAPPADLSTAPADDEEQGVCEVEAFAWLPGQPWPEARAEAEAQVTDENLTMRVVEPGGMMTMDYRMDRLTVLLSADGTVDEVRCG